MSAIRLNREAYHCRGVTRWDDGRQRCFEEFTREPLVVPVVKRYGPEVARDDTANRRWKLPPGSVGYTITIETCEVLTAAAAEIESARTEEHCARILADVEA